MEFYIQYKSTILFSKNPLFYINFHNIPLYLLNLFLNQGFDLTLRNFTFKAYNVFKKKILKKKLLPNKLNNYRFYTLLKKSRINKTKQVFKNKHVFFLNYSKLFKKPYLYLFTPIVDLFTPFYNDIRYLGVKKGIKKHLLQSNKALIKRRVFLAKLFLNKKAINLIKPLPHNFWYKKYSFFKANRTVKFIKGLRDSQPIRQIKFFNTTNTYKFTKGKKPVNFFRQISFLNTKVNNLNDKPILKGMKAELIQWNYLLFISNEHMPRLEKKKLKKKLLFRKNKPFKSFKIPLLESKQTKLLKINLLKKNKTLCKDTKILFSFRRQFKPFLKKRLGQNIVSLLTKLKFSKKFFRKTKFFSRNHFLKNLNVKTQNLVNKRFLSKVLSKNLRVTRMNTKPIRYNTIIKPILIQYSLYQHFKTPFNLLTKRFLGIKHKANTLLPIKSMSFFNFSSWYTVRRLLRPNRKHQFKNLLGPKLTGSFFKYFLIKKYLNPKRTLDLRFNFEKLKIESFYKLPFIFSNTGFLFLNSNIMISSKGYLINKGITRARINNYRLSFFYKNDFKKVLIKQPGFYKLLDSFRNHPFLENTNYLDPDHLLLKKFHHFSPNNQTKMQSIASGYFYNSINVERLREKYKSIEHKRAYDPDIAIKRIRFKPGYQRIWRRAREALNFNLNFNYRYQVGLTRRIMYIRRIKKHDSYRSYDYILYKVLVNARLVFDNRASLDLIKSNTVFINGVCSNNINFNLFCGDFIQLIVSLRYYIIHKWLINWNNYYSLKFIKLKNYKTNASQTDLSKQVSKHLPKWIFNIGYRVSDIPKYLEVDYFTLSIFIIYEPLFLTDYHPLTYLEDRSEIYTMYNWKYIT